MYKDIYIKEINEILNNFNNYVEFNYPIRTKKTPHSSEIKIFFLDKSINFHNFDIIVLQSILQRLKLINHFKNQNNESELKKRIKSN
jgi:hypothetical protein